MPDSLINFARDSSLLPCELAGGGDPLAVEQWLARHQAFWSGAMNQLEQLLSEPGSVS